MSDVNGQFQNKNKINVIETIILNDNEEVESEDSNINLKDQNKLIKNEIITYENNTIITKNQSTILNFEDSIDSLTDKFRKLFNKEDKKKLQIDIWNNKKFRESFILNNNMQLIFKFTDILREIYENQLQTKMIEKNCDINRIIEKYIEKIKKLSQKRRIVIKDYQNKIYVIGAEMHVDKIETQAKEFIVKKKTQLFKGNNKINTNDDKCYVIEISNNKRKKQIFYDLGDVTNSLEFLFQNLEKDAVFK